MHTMNILSANNATSSYDAAAQARLFRLVESRRATILAIETSCDETAAAVVRDGRSVLSNAVYSQIPLHERFGGVVPELASRNHVDQLGPTVQRALSEAHLALTDVDAIAATSHPGLIGALLTGLNYAKGLSLALSLPFIGVDHIAGHIAANYLDHPDLAPPFLALVASGGHSHIFHVASYTDIRLLGRTRDDAVGEAFDKVARALGLGYPGGPKLERLALSGDPHAIGFPLSLQAGLDFSFSGLKTAVINQLHTAQQREKAPLSHAQLADIAASFQHCAVRQLCEKARAALKQTGLSTLVLAGGVSANRTLTQQLLETAQNENALFFSPSPPYTGDNAAMIACAGYYSLLTGRRDCLDLNAEARNRY